MNERLHILHHNAAAALLTRLRDEKTPPDEFRRLMGAISGPLASAATQGLDFYPTQVVTPLGEMADGITLESVVLVPVLRAGEGLLKGFQELLPDTELRPLGLHRDERTCQPVLDSDRYLPESLEGRTCFVLDPMLATGGSAVVAVDLLKQRGASRVVFVGLIAAPEGVQRLSDAHPDVDIYVAAVDDGLDDRGFILPGLGDAGDRLNNTVPR
ncbi:MAG: uracil phosphoribosyltransferase [Patescibacteria group bacterium]|nr:uracil phosphoribosyltransferase [Patescibacteria group bacterium]